ncbi:unnamed protein product [Alopecurus aequalis]
MVASGVNTVDVVPQAKPTIKSRFSTLRFCKAVSQLNPVQIGHLSRHSLAHLLKLPKHLMIPMNLLQWLVDHTFSDGSDSYFIRYKENEIALTKNIADKVFGFRPDSSVPYRLESDDPDALIEVELLRKQYSNGRNIPVTRVESIMLGSNDERVFLRSFIMFFISTVLCPVTYNFVNPKFLHSLRDRDILLVEFYDLGSLCLEHLFEEIENWRKKLFLDSSNYNKELWIGGCLPLLGVAHLDFIDFAGHAAVIDYRLPRMCFIKNADFNLLATVDRNNQSHKSFGVLPQRIATPPANWFNSGRADGDPEVLSISSSFNSEGSMDLNVDSVAGAESSFSPFVSEIPHTPATDHSPWQVFSCPSTAAERYVPLAPQNASTAAESSVPYDEAKPIVNHDVSAMRKTSVRGQKMTHRNIDRFGPEPSFNAIDEAILESTISPQFVGLILSNEKSKASFKPPVFYPKEHVVNNSSPIHNISFLSPSGAKQKSVNLPSAYQKCNKSPNGSESSTKSIPSSSQVVFSTAFKHEFYNLIKSFAGKLESSPRIFQVGSKWVDQRTLTLSIIDGGWLHKRVMDCFTELFLFDQYMRVQSGEFLHNEKLLMDPLLNHFEHKECFREKNVGFRLENAGLVHIPCAVPTQQPQAVWFLVVANFIDKSFDVLNPNNQSDSLTHLISSVCYNFKILFLESFPHSPHLNIRDFKTRYIEVPKARLRVDSGIFVLRFMITFNGIEVEMFSQDDIQSLREKYLSLLVLNRHNTINLPFIRKFVSSFPSHVMT